MRSSDEIYWTAGFLNERFPGPISPLGWSIVGPLFERYALREPLRFMGFPGADTIPATRLFQGHPYANVQVFQIIYKPFPDWLLPADAVRYFPGGDTTWRQRAPYPAGWFDPRLIGSLIVHLMRDPLAWSPLNYIAWSRYTRRHDADVALLRRELERAAAPADFLRIIHAADRVHANLLRIHRWSLTYADVSYRLLAHLAGPETLPLISDVQTITRRANKELAGLVALARKLDIDLSSPEGLSAARRSPEFDAALDRVISRQGHRSFSLDVRSPTLAENPAQFLNLLATAPPPSEDSKKTTSLASRVRKRVNGPLSLFFYPLLYLARRYALLREDQRYYWHKSMAVTRRAFLQLGRALSEDAVIESPESVFFAERKEIEAYFVGKLPTPDLQAAIRQRRGEWDSYEQAYRRSPALAYPAFLKGDKPLEDQPEARQNLWQGRGVSAGRAIGRVRVIVDARELGRVAPGEVLVAPSTDPGWTPVFSRLAALVLERGGVLAHGAVVAREHRLPAVAGISHITDKLIDGDLVEVDGTTGSVRRLPH